MTGEDLKSLQDHFINGSKQILLENESLRPISFVITLHKHVEKLFESGYGLEFLDPKTADVGNIRDDQVSVLIVDLALSWKKLYHAVLTVFPETQHALPQMITLGTSMGVDDVHMRTMKGFLAATGMDEKDVMAATVRQICAKVDAFACVFHSEAWLRAVDPKDTATIEESRQKGLARDTKSVEVLLSVMETRDFTRGITIPILRGPTDDPEKRDGGKVLGFGAPTETNALDGRMSGFLKPLKVVS